VKNVFSLILVVTISGCGINDIETASTPIAHEDFKAYATRHMNGNLDHPSNLNHDATNTIKSYLSNYCTHKNGKVEELDTSGHGIGSALDRIIFHGSGGYHDIRICRTNNNEFITGFAYSSDHIYYMIDSVRVITNQDWDEANAEVAENKENQRKDEQKHIQEERDHQLFTKNIKLGMSVNFSKPEIGVYDNTGVGVIQQIDQQKNTVTILAANVFNRDNSNARILGVATSTLRAPKDTRSIIQLPINLK
jgi:hypothetical protein